MPHGTSIRRFAIGESVTARKLYQVLSDEFVGRLQRQPHIGAFDLFRIAAWKSAQSAMH